MAAALLMRTDADIFCFYLGDDPHGTAAALSSGHYFGVDALLMAVGDEAARTRFENLATETGAIPLGHGWWTGAPLDALASIFARACCKREGASRGETFFEEAAPRVEAPREEAACEETFCEEV